jgi:hypothetical protein
MENLTHELITELLKTKAAKPNRNGDEVVQVRCPFCGDSDNQSHTHMYIAKKEDGTFTYDCKRCPSQGVVTPDFLHRLNINNIAFDEFIKTINAATGHSKSHTMTLDDEKKLVVYYPPTKGDDRKLVYLNNRTKLDFSKKSVYEEYKCITNVDEFYRMNEIPPPLFATEHPKEWKEDLIGFLSYDDKSMSLRNISGNGLRYMITQFNPLKKSPFMYIPQSSILILSEKPVLVMTEGVFNLVNIKNHFFTEDNYDTIFVAVASRKNYLRALMMTLLKTCFFGATVIMYVDKEANFDLDNYRSLFGSFLSSFNFKFIMNKTGKNFDDLSVEQPFDFSVYKL